AELEHQVATVAWAELAGDVDPEAALAARAEIEGYAVQMASAEHHVEATELIHRELVDDAEPAWATARAALLEACRSFDVEPEHAISEVAAIVSEAHHARLQQAVEDAQAALRLIEAELETHLAAAGRREALSRRVMILETSAGTGPHLVTAEEAEMVLLGRFAQTRRVGPEAEPVPVLVDDALAAFPRHEKWRLLDLLARLGEASQVVYLTDDEETVDWARSRAVNGGVGLLLA